MIDHNPFSRQGTGEHAVLLIHGIAGSPGHFRDLVPVIPEEFSVYNILLDGHNGTVADFAKTSMAKWKAQVAATLDDLFARHEKVVIVAHSMGTLFAIQAAIDHPDRIPCLFLLSVPTRPWVRLSTLVTSVRVAFGKLDDPKAQAMRNDAGIMLTSKLWKYLGWVPRMIELLRECRRIRKILPQLRTPALSFQSRADELVSIRSCRDLEFHPYITNLMLLDSGHFAYGRKDIPYLQKSLQQMLSGLERSPHEKAL